MQRKALALVLASFGCGGAAKTATHSAADVSAQAAQIVASPERTEKDRDKDKYRHPVEALAFFGVTPGMHVADLGAGAGYNTVLLALAVGPTGSVVAQDTPNWDSEGLKKIWTMRLAQPSLSNT